MNKILLSSLVVSLGFMTQNIQLPNANMVFNSIAQQISSWQNSNYELNNTFVLNDKEYLVYKVDKNKDNSGYFIMNNNKLVSFYVGNFKSEKLNKIELLSPIFNTDDTYTIENNRRNLASESTASYIPPTLITDNYQYTSMSNYRAQIINNCPFYYNYPYGPIYKGCVPTSGAMLICFYDRYTNLTNLINGTLPLNHEDNKELIDNFINLLAILMETKSTGTDIDGEKNSLNTYFKAMGYSQYQAYQNYSFNEYENFITNYHQPTLLGIKTINNTGHAVLGVGSAEIQNSGSFMITHYDDRYSCTGDYYVAKEYFLDSVYMAAPSNSNINTIYVTQRS